MKDISRATMLGLQAFIASAFADGVFFWGLMVLALIFIFLGTGVTHKACE